MVTLDAWVAMLLLLGMAGVAFVPRLAARARGNRLLAGMGRASDACFAKGYWVWFALALGVGLWVRAWRFPELPRGLNQDEAMSAAEALSLLREGTDQYGTPWPAHFEAWKYGQMSVLLSYRTMPFFALLGVSRLSIRLPTLVLALAALPVFWDFSRRVFGRKFALLALWMLAICPWQIMQSRWSMDADLLQHLLLFSMYFLLLGITKKPFLYLSMVFFGLTMYTYGITLYTVPPLLVILCVYLLAKRRIHWWEALLCAALYLVVAAPFLLTMLDNFFEWDPMTLGPISIPRFYETVRTESIIFFSENPFAELSGNLSSFLSATVLQNMGNGVLVYKPTRTLYAFSWPMILLGILLLWWQRRRRVLAPPAPAAPEELRLEGAFLVLAWLFAAFLCAMFTNISNTNRSNGAFYPLLLCLCVALYAIVRRVRGFALPIALLYALGFLVFCQGYFHNTPYITRISHELHNDLYGALVEARPMDCDRYYIDTTAAGEKSAEMMAALAHEITASQFSEDKLMYGMDGQELDYYSFRYIYTDFQDFEPDPTECAAYIITDKQKERFDLSEYLVTEHDLYTLLYPRYWAE